MADTIDLINEQEKENLSLQQQAEKDAFERAEAEKTAIREAAEKEAAEELVKSEDEIAKQIAEREIKAGRDGYDHQDFIDDVQEFGGSVIEALKDYFEEVKEAVLDKLDEAALSIDSEFKAEQEQALENYPSWAAEKFGKDSWQAELAEDLSHDPSIKTSRQMAKKMAEFDAVVQNTDIQDMEMFLEKDNRWKESWQKEYLHNLVEKGETKTMDEALSSMVAHERWREKNPEVALIEDYKFDIERLDRQMEQAQGKELDELQKRRETALGAYDWARENAAKNGKLTPEELKLTDQEREQSKERSAVKKNEFKCMSLAEYQSALNDAYSKQNELVSEAIRERDIKQAEMEQSRDR